MFRGNIWGFPKTRGTFFSIPIVWTNCTVEPILGSPILGNCHVAGVVGLVVPGGVALKVHRNLWNNIGYSQNYGPLWVVDYIMAPKI